MTDTAYSFDPTQTIVDCHWGGFDTVLVRVMAWGKGSSGQIEGGGSPFTMWFVYPSPKAEITTYLRDQLFDGTFLRYEPGFIVPNYQPGPLHGVSGTPNLVQVPAGIAYDQPPWWIPPPDFVIYDNVWQQIGDAFIGFDSLDDAITAGQISVFSTEAEANAYVDSVNELVDAGNATAAATGGKTAANVIAESRDAGGQNQIIGNLNPITIGGFEPRFTHEPTDPIQLTQTLIAYPGGVTYFPPFADGVPSGTPVIFVHDTHMSPTMDIPIDPVNQDMKSHVYIWSPPSDYMGQSNTSVTTPTGGTDDGGFPILQDNYAMFTAVIVNISRIKSELPQSPPATSFSFKLAIANDGAIMSFSAESYRDQTQFIMPGLGEADAGPGPNPNFDVGLISGADFVDDLIGSWMSPGLPTRKSFIDGIALETSEITVTVDLNTLALSFHPT